MIQHLNLPKLDFTNGVNREGNDLGFPFFTVIVIHGFLHLFHFRIRETNTVSDEMSFEVTVREVLEIKLTLLGFVNTEGEGFSIFRHFVTIPHFTPLVCRGVLTEFGQMSFTRFLKVDIDQSVTTTDLDRSREGVFLTTTEVFDDGFSSETDKPRFRSDGTKETNEFNRMANFDGVVFHFVFVVRCCFH